MQMLTQGSIEKIEIEIRSFILALGLKLGSCLSKKSRETVIMVLYHACFACVSEFKFFKLVRGVVAGLAQSTTDPNSSAVLKLFRTAPSNTSA